MVEIFGYELSNGLATAAVWVAIAFVVIFVARAFGKDILGWFFSLFTSKTNV